MSGRAVVVSGRGGVGRWCRAVVVVSGRAGRWWAGPRWWAVVVVSGRAGRWCRAGPRLGGGPRWCRAVVVGRGDWSGGRWWWAGRMVGR